MGTKANPGEFDCYANAEENEPMFVILGRDVNGPSVVRTWVNARIKTDPEQAAEALALSVQMEDWLEDHGKKPVDVPEVKVARLVFNFFQRGHNGTLWDEYLEFKGELVGPEPNGWKKFDPDFIELCQAIEECYGPRLEE